MKEVKDGEWVQLHTLIPSVTSIKAKRNAKAAGMNLSEYMASLINSRDVVFAKDNLRPDIEKLISWYGRINSNLNMLSKHANIYKDNARTALILHVLNDIRRDVLDITKHAEKLQPRRGRPSND